MKVRVQLTLVMGIVVGLGAGYLWYQDTPSAHPSSTMVEATHAEVRHRMERAMRQSMSSNSVVRSIAQTEYESLARSLDVTVESEVAVRRSALEGALAARYEEYRRMYEHWYPTPPAANLAIVNLQLPLMARMFSSPEEQQLLERQLQQLLADSDPAVRAHETALQQKIAEMMAPYRQEARRELDAYEAERRAVADTVLATERTRLTFTPFY